MGWSKRHKRLAKRRALTRQQEQQRLEKRTVAAAALVERALLPRFTGIDFSSRPGQTITLLSKGPDRFYTYLEYP